MGSIANYELTPCVSDMLGICEEQSKMYGRYFARVQKQMTTQVLTNIDRVVGSACKQDNVTRRKI